MELSRRKRTKAYLKANELSYVDREEDLFADCYVAPKLPKKPENSAKSAFNIMPMSDQQTVSTLVMIDTDSPDKTFAYPILPNISSATTKDRTRLNRAKKSSSVSPTNSSVNLVEVSSEKTLFKRNKFILGVAILAAVVLVCVVIAVTLSVILTNCMHINLYFTFDLILKRIN